MEDNFSQRLNAHFDHLKALLGDNASCFIQTEVKPEHLDNNFDKQGCKPDGEGRTSPTSYLVVATCNNCLKSFPSNNRLHQHQQEHSTDIYQSDHAQNHFADGDRNDCGDSNTNDSTGDDKEHDYLSNAVEATGMDDDRNLTTSRVHLPTNILKPDQHRRGKT